MCFTNSFWPGWKGSWRETRTFLCCHWSWPFFTSIGCSGRKWKCGTGHRRLANKSGLWSRFLAVTYLGCRSWIIVNAKVAQVIRSALNFYPPPPPLTKFNKLQSSHIICAKIFNKYLVVNIAVQKTRTINHEINFIFVSIIKSHI